MPDNVVALVGYMGSGKTTIGKELASRLGWELLDLDAEIETSAGMTIPDIFSGFGEPAFRDLESSTLHDALQRAVSPSGDSSDGMVLSCGGGIVLREENRMLLLDIPTVFVHEDVRVLYIRTRGEGRPLRGGGLDEFESRYREREPLYREVSGITLDCSGRGQYELAGEVARWLGR